jgi:alkylhydroperoxidase/carboxymuconolactone decarboxylase family protein YurZ
MEYVFRGQGHKDTHSAMVKAVLLEPASLMEPSTGETDPFTALFEEVDREVRFGSVHRRLDMDAKTLALLSLAMVAGKLQVRWVPEHVRACVKAGLGRTEIAEVLMQVYCYAGVYASLAAFKAAGATLTELEQTGQLAPELHPITNQPAATINDHR